MNGPPEYACPWDRGMPPMDDFSHWGNIAGPLSMHGPPTFGSMKCPCDTNLPCEDETVDDESDEWDAGKESAGDAGKENAVDAGKENAENAGKDEPSSYFFLPICGRHSGFYFSSCFILLYPPP